MAGMVRLLAGFVAAWAVLDRTAALTASVYGAAGLVVASAAIAALLVVEVWLFRTGWRGAFTAVGLGRPRGRALALAALIGALMLGFFPVFSLVAGASLVLRDGWALLVPGLLAQGGIAEEALFRGYLYGHLRRTRGYWRAACLSVLPFVAVHLLLFTYMHPAVAAAATFLSLAMGFPLARLYDLGGGTVWAPAVLHFVAQGAVKLVVAPAAAQMTMAMGWMAACMGLPWLVFLARSGRRARAEA